MLNSADHYQRLAEIGLLMSDRMRQRHEHFLATLLAHVILDDCVAAGEPALVLQPLEHTLGRMALFARHLQVLIQPTIDDRNERIELRPTDR